ncbi:hypothetical protein D3C80_1199840 [compost metagenome]
MVWRSRAQAETVTNFGSAIVNVETLVECVFRNQFRQRLQDRQRQWIFFTRIGEAIRFNAIDEFEEVNGVLGNAVWNVLTNAASPVHPEVKSWTTFTITKMLQTQLFTQAGFDVLPVNNVLL